MKKILLTLAAGILILAMPVIASAAVGVGFDSYSGFSAGVTVHGFQLYSSATGSKVKPFTWTERADRSFSGPKNAAGNFNTAESGNPGSFEIMVHLNSNAAMIFEGVGAIGNANGGALICNALVGIVRTTGNLSPLGGFTETSNGTADEIICSAVLHIAQNTTTHALTISVENATSFTDASFTVTNGVESPPTSGGQVVAPFGSGRSSIPAVTISPITLKLNASGYSGPWWNLPDGTGFLF